MQLDNEHMISQTLATTIEEVETMYWMTESAIYKGDIKQAKIVFEFLLYLAKYKPAFIQKGLQKPYRARLQQISHELYEKSVPKKETSIVIRPAVKPQKIPFKKEAELREYLADHPKILSKAIGQDIKVTGTEIETDDDYRCDIVAENGKYLYPIELKIVKGTHQVVSQCTKYCYYFYRKLRMIDSRQYKEL